jgi:hypothetical protein
MRLTHGVADEVVGFYKDNVGRELRRASSYGNAPAVYRLPFGQGYRNLSCVANQHNQGIAEILASPCKVLWAKEVGTPTPPF